ncbi:unnamed protein product [Mycena citricolor]|uniref:DUF1295-domain-containing protein n=1 Tax=Mycena citricolor TaxID=2018698 RepID=A0AAD2Q372_9AGAR|nr:unnamed protein product [Mycena citricolor]
MCSWMHELTFRRKDEDYRWAVLRSQLHPALFQIVNLTFIAFTQNVLLLLLGVPAYYAAIQPVQSLDGRDYGVIALTLVVLALEFTADNQQYSFQTYKHTPRRYHEHQQWPGSRLDWTKEDVDRGFLTRGLWAWCRHPNFMCEQSFWWIMNLASLPHLPTVHLAAMFQSPFSDWLEHLGPLAPLTPAVALSILFFSSTVYTEAITAGKYKGYAAYQARVGMFSPPITVFKQLKLAMTGELPDVDKIVWGSKYPKLKTE